MRSNTSPREMVAYWGHQMEIAYTQRRYNHCLLKKIYWQGRANCGRPRTRNY